MSVASTGLAVRRAGADRCDVEPQRDIVERTALGPATLVTVMVTEPPAATLIGTLTQAPCEKSVLMLALRTPEPSFSSRSRRHTASLCDWSSGVCSSDLAAGKLRWRRIWLGS